MAFPSWSNSLTSPRASHMRHPQPNPRQPRHLHPGTTTHLAVVACNASARNFSFRILSPSSSLDDFWQFVCFPCQVRAVCSDGVMKSSGGMCSPFVSKNISAKLVYAFWELENFLMRTWLHIMESFLKERYRQD